MDAAIPADAQNAPTGIWKSRTEREIPTAPTPIIVVVNERKNNGDSNSVAKPSTESDQAHRGTLFHDTPVSARARRSRWLDEAVSSVQASAVVFCDPDNGLTFDEPRRSLRHIGVDEIRSLYSRGQSLVVYHTPDRSAPHAEQIASSLERLRQAIPDLGSSWAARFRRGSSRVFFVLAQRGVVASRLCCGAVWPAFLVILRRIHTTGMQSKVHPTYKTKYRVANWAAYNQALVRRGDVTVWLSSEAIAAWTPRRSGRRGGQRRYSDLAIETALTLRLLYHLPLRQAEGFLHALFGMMRLDLSAPDYTTLSRRSRHLRRRLRPSPPGEAIHLVLDSTGLSIVGEGEWAAAKHGGRGRRGWRKLHLGVDQSGVIRVHTLTEATGDDATTALDLLTAVEGPLVRVTADAAYDTVGVYETAGARGATVVIPPARTATVSAHGPRSPARDRTITLVKQLGRRQWQKASGYHRQGRVENTFFRYKSIIGDGLRARSPAGQGSEVVLGCEILNRMTALGRPVSYCIGR